MATLDFDSLPDAKKSATLDFDSLPDAPKGYLSRLNEDILRRGKNVGESIKGTNLNPFSRNFQTPIETLGQVAGQGMGLISDALIAEPLTSAYRYLTPKSAQAAVASGAETVAQSGLARALGAATNAYSNFAKENPVLNRNLGAAANTAAFYTPVGNTSLATITAGAPKAISRAVTGTGKAVVNAPFTVGRGAYNIGNKATDYIAGGISGKINKAWLPAEIIKDASGNVRSNAEILFLETLRNEGISFDDAIKQLSSATDMGVTPSVAITSNIPQMQTQAYLMSKGSSGSKVAADAIKDIREVQIPKMNTELIKAATGADPLAAEQYGAIASKGAKGLIADKVTKLQTRAKPFYERSVGIDKSVPIENPLMQKALGNNVVSKALDDWRTNPYTITNVKDELNTLGVATDGLDKLPYNSTVALHAARTHLRGQADIAFRSGDSQAYKAIKSGISDIDNAIESTFPDYKTARRIYSEDAGALKTLKESAVGQMANVAESDYSKIADSFMKKDAQFIRKSLKDAKPEMRNAIAGAFLKRQLEESSKDGLRFSDRVFKTSGNENRLRAIVGLERFEKMKKIDEITDQLFSTQGMGNQSITAAAQSLERGVNVPTSFMDIITSIKEKIAPSLMDMVKRDPTQAKRYNELLFSGEGDKLLKSISIGNKATASDYEKIGGFLNKNASKLTSSQVK